MNNAGSQRLRKLSPSFYLDQGERIRRLKERGTEVIRLDIGSPDLPPPPEVIHRLSETARLPHAHGYQSHTGPLELRLAWAEAYQRWFDVPLSPEDHLQPLIGSKEGIFNLTQALVDPGQVVLVPDPAYPTYAESARFTGAQVVAIPLTAETNWLPDLDALDPSVLDRTRLMWLNYPNNPTGATCTQALFEKAVTLAHRHHFLICHDAAYTRITFDSPAPSILQVPGALDVAVEFNSLSKTFNMAGWRMGILAGNREAIAALRQLKAQSESGQFLPAIHAAVSALAAPQEWIDARNDIYKRRRDVLCAALNQIPSLEVSAPSAGLYLWVRLKDAGSAQAYCHNLMEATGICIAPGSLYGQQGEGYIRISLVAPENELREAAKSWKAWADEKAQPSTRP